MSGYASNFMFPYDVTTRRGQTSRTERQRSTVPNLEIHGFALMWQESLMLHDTF